MMKCALANLAPADSADSTTLAPESAHTRSRTPIPAHFPFHFSHTRTYVFMACCVAPV